MYQIEKKNRSEINTESLITDLIKKNFKLIQFEIRNLTEKVKNFNLNKLLVLEKNSTNFPDTINYKIHFKNYIRSHEAIYFEWIKQYFPCTKNFINEFEIQILPFANLFRVQ